MVFSHDPWLVLLSLVVAIQGAYVGLSLARELARQQDHRRLLLAGAAVSLATATWAMHFIGMLAVRLPAPINFLVLPTLLSALVSVLFVGVSVFLAATFPASRPMQATAALTMGSGIVAMHFTGMTALHAGAMMHHDPVYVVASWVIGVTASRLALSYAFTDHGRTPLAYAAAALGLAISGMHYTAMAGMTLMPMPVSPAPSDMALSADALALVVAMVAFGLSAVFLLTLVPDHPLIGSGKAPELVAIAGGGAVEIFRGSVMAEAAAKAGAPAGPERELPKTASTAKAAQEALLAVILPVHQHGCVRNLPVSLIYAVKADAHYTWVFDGRESHFCGLSITEIEARLNPSQFARVHRSHLVAVDRIARIRKSGDGGVVELESPTAYSLPVSRRQFPVMRAVLNSRG